MKSLLSWERGLKCNRPNKQTVDRNVAPLVGAWIEIFVPVSNMTEVSVAPLVGAWIEMIESAERLSLRLVAPLVGAWIEIYIYHC